MQCTRVAAGLRLGPPVVGGRVRARGGYSPTGALGAWPRAGIVFRMGEEFAPLSLSPTSRSSALRRLPKSLIAGAGAAYWLAGTALAQPVISPGKIAPGSRSVAAPFPDDIVPRVHLSRESSSSAGVSPRKADAAF